MTLAATKTVRVYRVAARYSDRVYACRYATRRRTFLGEEIDASPGSAIGVRNVRIAGGYVAFTHETAGSTGNVSRAKVIDTRTGRTIRFARRGFLGEEGERYEGALGADAVVTARGTAAFIFELYDRGYENRRYAVAILDGPAPESVRWVDEGADIDHDSLELRGGRVEWRRTGPESSAAIG